MKTITIGNVLNRLFDLFSLELEEYVALDSCVEALKKLKHTPKVKKVALATSQEYLVNLPDAVNILAVLDGEGPQLPSMGLAFPGAGMHPWLIQEGDYIEVVEGNEPILKPEQLKTICQLKGPYAHYNEDLPFLSFPFNNHHYIIIYTGLPLDGYNNPMIPEICRDYLVYYLLLEEYQKRFVRKECSLGELREINDWCQRAARNVSKIPTSKNTMDEIFNVMTSFDRKSFNTPL